MNVVIGGTVTAVHSAEDISAIGTVVTIVVGGLEIEVERDWSGRCPTCGTNVRRAPVNAGDVG